MARPRSSEATYLRIARELAEAIRRGEAAPGDPVASEAEVCQAYGVARGTARAALRALEADGLVEAIPGVGRIVRGVEPAAGAPRYRRVAEALAEEIRRGELPPGARLAGEVELARRFGVSRNTVRAALGILEARGLVDVEHGRGRTVRAPA